MPRNSFASNMTDWKLLNESLKTNLGELPELVGSQAELETLLGSLSQAHTEQEAMRAQLFQATANRQQQVDTGRSLVSRVRLNLRAHYGVRAKKLTEFGIRPLADRRRSPPAQPEPQTAPAESLTAA